MDDPMPENYTPAVFVIGKKPISSIFYSEIVEGLILPRFFFVFYPPPN